METAFRDPTVRSAALRALARSARALSFLVAIGVPSTSGAVVEAIVRFRSGAVDFPTQTASATPGQLTFDPSALATGLEDLEVDLFTRICPACEGETSGPGELSLARIFVVRGDPEIPNGAEPGPWFADQLAALPGVAQAEPMAEAELFWAPNDPEYSDQWHLENTGQLDGLPDVDIDLEEAWDISLGANFPVHVLDTGQPDNSDLVGGASVGNCSDSGSEEDLLGHGTAVAGIIAARCNNNTRTAGINCPGSPSDVIRSVKITSQSNFPISQAICGVVEATQDDARIMNMSWGTCTPSFALAAAARNAYLNGSFGCLLVAAGGNANAVCRRVDRAYPAGYDALTLAAGAVVRGGLPWASNIIGSEPNWYLDVVAPGGGQITTLGIDDTVNDAFGGTSAAAPVVSGIAALLLSVNDDLTNDDLAHIIRRTAVPISAPAFGGEQGAGRVSAYRALRFVSGGAREFLQGVVDAEDVEVVETSSAYNKTFKNLSWCFDDPSLPDAATVYSVKRLRLEGTVVFSSNKSLTSGDNVWVRHGSGESPGWPDLPTLDCAEQVGWGGVVEHEWDQTSAILYTYTYELRDGSTNEFIGYFPIDPDDVEIPWSAVLGPFDEPAVAEVISPNGGQVWNTMGTRNITWSASDDDGIDDVDIHWSTNYGLTWQKQLADETANDGAFVWQIGQENHGGDHCRIAVVADDGAEDGNYDVSDADFEVNYVGEQELSVDFDLQAATKVDTWAAPGGMVVYTIPNARPVQLELFDLQGRLVRRLASGTSSAGVHRVQWDYRTENGSPAASGVYFYRLQAGPERLERRIVLVR